MENGMVSVKEIRENRDAVERVAVTQAEMLSRMIGAGQEIDITLIEKIADQMAARNALDAAIVAMKKAGWGE